MSLSPSDFFIIASIIQGFFIGIAILCAPFFRSKTNNYLAGFIIALSGITFLGWQELDLFWPNYLFTIMWEFLIPIFVFHYFLRVLDHRFLQAPWLPWLFAPFIVFLIIDVLIDFDYVFDLYELPFAEQSPGYRYFDDLLDTMALWWNIFLTIWMFSIAWQDRQAPPERRRWLIRFGVVMLGIMTVWFLSDLVETVTEIDDPYIAIWFTMSLVFWWVAYAGVYQLRILEERSDIHALLVRKAPPKVLASTAPTSLSENTYVAKLNQLMTQEHLYRNPDLGRQLVAEHLGISEGYVSQVIRGGLDTGFVEYVNRYRIAAAQEMLRDAAFAPYSLEAIGREAGFKSRSAFYDAFKKATGVTPGTYRKQAKKS